MKPCCVKSAAAMLLGIALSLLLQGCGSGTPQSYRMGQTIHMGPYAFELERTEQHSFYDGMEIHVMVRISEDSADPYANSFDQMLGHWSIRDAAGNAFDCYVLKPLSGDRRSATQWAALFRVFTSDSHEGVRDAARVGKRPSDFVLTMENPFPREGQPRNVSVQLR